MRNRTHIKLTLTRGQKLLPDMRGRLTAMGPWLTIVANGTRPVDHHRDVGVRTASQRSENSQLPDATMRAPRALCDPPAKVPDNISGTDLTNVLGHMGFVSELNDANLFMIKEGMVSIPLLDACMHGIAPGTITDICRDDSIPITEKSLSPTEFGDADVVFATGIIRETTPVKEIDGRRIINLSLHIKLENILSFHKTNPQYSKNQINYGKDNQKKCDHQVTGRRTLERT